MEFEEQPLTQFSSEYKAIWIMPQCTIVSKVQPYSRPYNGENEWQRLGKGC